MYNNVLEKRIKKNDIYEITIQIPEDDYFNSYESLTRDSAAEILQNYLKYHHDDGKPDDIEIHHNKNAHIVNINANLHYLDNNHREM
ncbi:hypothetical protein SAMN05443428_11662 [Caloramator quimbayensis]|uniref:Uncharacterized protein n=1 Tax=Caloramator quimbayensis TaxID=1147123 RepID=A0A1T4Y020_9CLOT|nr:hypothetical protein [Caloramator quimbayensis]SKA94798.1 hypothetical protein SAMN05443428_11662 [Caloramator quimbayensis]